MIYEKRREKKECVIVIVDFEKAYDPVREFLAYMMERLGFCNKWIKWALGCLKSSTLSILVNGSPTSSLPILKSS